MNVAAEPLMTMTIETGVRERLLLVVVGGEFSLSEGMRTFREVVDALIEHKCERVLFDGRTISGDPPSIIRFYYGEFAANYIQRLRQKGSLLFNPEFAYVLVPPVLDARRLGEVVANHRGMNVRAFDDLEAATRYLEID